MSFCCFFTKIRYNLQFASIVLVIFAVFEGPEKIAKIQLSSRSLRPQAVQTALFFSLPVSWENGRKKDTPAEPGNPWVKYSDSLPTISGPSGHLHGQSQRGLQSPKSAAPLGTGGTPPTWWSGTPAPLSGAGTRQIPVSYTHLDVYKRQPQW